MFKRMNAALLQMEVSNHHLVTKTTYVQNSDKAEEQVAWPNERSLADIEKLYNIQFGKLLFELPKQSNVLDVGPGLGRLLNEIAEKYSDKELNCYGIGSSKLDGKYQSKAKDIKYSFVPKSKSWLVRNFSRFHFGWDTYAALTYSENPLHSLIYILLSLKPGAQFYSMSSLTPDDTENSCFGDSKTRQDIQDFFEKTFGTKLDFDLIKIESKACKPGTYMDDLRIAFRVPQNGLKLPPNFKNQTTWDLFNSLCELANEKIGVPILLKDKNSFNAGPYHITMRQYVKKEEPVNTNKMR